MLMLRILVTIERYYCSVGDSTNARENCKFLLRSQLLSSFYRSPLHFPFTSHASRRPSPRKFSANKVATNTPAGKKISHQ